MKAIMVMFDSLNREWLPGYGGSEKEFPNFARLLRQTTLFDHAYVCSMPCMPARRELHTGRPQFMHTGWGPLQPYDDSMPQMLRENGTSTHLVTDHYHYFEDGGCTYHPRYSTWQFFRGQEGDPWMGQVAPPVEPPHINTKGRPQDWVNRQFWRREADWSQVQTFTAGLEFLERNHGEDNWFLQIESFDPHEPFVAPENHQAHYPQAGEEPIFDWPAYGPVIQSAAEAARLRDNYSALVRLCDSQLGRVLDFMDAQEMWQDTLLVVCTDHGFLLGEQNLFGKNFYTLWDEIGHTPFYVWDPRSPEAAGQRRSSLVQPMLDLAPTLLNFFALEPTGDMTGHDLAGVVANDVPVREVALSAYFGRPINITDGRYNYVRTVQDTGQVYHSYTLMPTLMRGFFPPHLLEDAELVPPLPFTKGISVVRYPRRMLQGTDDADPCALYDRETDPDQRETIVDAEVADRLSAAALKVLRKCHAPAEYLQRFGW